MREGLAPLLNRQSDMEVVAQASDEGAAIEMFRQD
jgi:DNA-binding NarL/FixJ family response regulator